MQLKLKLIASLLAIPLVAGCAGTNSVAVPAEASPSPAPAAAVQHTQSGQADQFRDLPGILDLTRQELTVPQTEFGQVKVPVSTRGSLNPGYSVITGHPGAGLVASSCGSPGGASAAIVGSRETAASASPIQFMNWIPGCDEEPSPAFHKVVLPVIEQFTEQQAVAWLKPGRIIVIVGTAPVTLPPMNPTLTQA